MKPLPIPPCPRCLADRAEEEDNTGSSAHWYASARCGMRYSAPPQPVADRMTSR